MKRSVSTGWAVAIVTLVVVVIGGVYVFGSNQSGTHHSAAALNSNKPKPPQPFIPKATGP